MKIPIDERLPQRPNLPLPPTVRSYPASKTYEARWHWLPHQYDPDEFNALHASLHSLLASLRCASPRDRLYWAKQARRQIASAIMHLEKPAPDCLR